MDRRRDAFSFRSSKCKNEPRVLPAQASAFELLDDCGHGVTATVRRARVKDTGEIVAVKQIDLERIQCKLDDIIHECSTMKQYHHPNVLPLHCSFLHDEQLWMVMPYISSGSIRDVMQYAYPEGLDEMTIATVTKRVLKGLDYIHKHGGIHRDIKAGNILLDDDGVVWIADFGVAATMERAGNWDKKDKRHTFVGTPCWMAPEVMEQADDGYDSSADIWSIGITLLEMAYGKAPFSNMPPMKVMMMVLEKPPPVLQDTKTKHFSAFMKDIVTKCLNKDPKLRPTAAQLLEHKFFRQAKDSDYLVRCLLSGIPQLADRMVLLRQSSSSSDLELGNRFKVPLSRVDSWNFDVVPPRDQSSYSSTSSFS